MGCCLFATVLAGAPRLAFLLWWLFQPVRINATFTNFLWPLLGVLFVPFTTLMYVIVFPEASSASTGSGSAWPSQSTSAPTGAARALGASAST